MKRILTLTLSLLMALSLCLTISADEGKNKDAVNDSNNVAQIDNEGYTTLKAAVEAITKSESKKGTIKLLTNVTGEQITLNTKDAEITIDLAGFNISNGSQPFLINNGSLALIGSGKVYESDNDQLGAIVIRPSYSTLDGGKITVDIGKDVTVAGWSGIFISFQEINGAKNLYNGNVTVNLEGTAMSPGIEGQHTAAGHGIYLNGELINTTEYATINVKDGAKVISKNHNDAVKKDGQGLYLAGYAKTTIGNAEVSGYYSAIEIRAGELNINGGSFSSDYSDVTSSASHSGGPTTMGTAIAIAQHTTTLPIEVNISGGEFKGSTALYESNAQNNTFTETNKVSLDITGGTFTSTKGSAIYSQDVKSFINGGAFSSDVSSYLASNHNVAKVGNEYKVTKDGATLAVETTTPAIEEGTIDTIKTSTEVKDVNKQKVAVDDSTKIELVVKDKVLTDKETESIKTVEKQILTDSTKEELKLIPLDISLLATTNGTTSTITDLGKTSDGKDVEIKVTLYLDNDTYAKLKNKDVKVIRIHDDGTKVLDTEFEGNALTFTTGKFSTYVIAYAENKPVETKQETVSTKSYNPKDKNHDGVISCQEEMNSTNWTWSETKKACVYRVTNTSTK